MIEHENIENPSALLSALIKDYGNPITVLDFDTWQDVKAYGTCEMGSKDNALWSMRGKLYHLCFAILPISEQENVLSAYSH